MMKRFFLIAIMAVATLVAWADGEVSNKTLWTFGDYPGQSAKVYNLNGLYLHSSETNSAFTDFAAVTEHAKTLSGTFTWPTQWAATKILESAKGCDLSALGDIDAASTSGADGSLAFNYSKSGKLYIVYGAITTTDGTFNVMQKTTGETSYTSVLSETMKGIDYTGELNAPTRAAGDYTYTQQEAIVTLSGSGTVYLGGLQPYCIYAILYLPDPYGTYDFQTWAEANLSSNVQATITLDNGIMTGMFSDMNTTEPMTLNDAFSITGTSYNLRKNGSTGNANSGLMIASASAAKLTINRLKAGDWFTIKTNTTERLAFATANENIHKVGSSETVVKDDYVESEATYLVTASTTADLYNKASGAVYIHSIQISDEDTVFAPTITVDGNDQVTIDGGTSLKGYPVTVYYTTDNSDPTTSATRQVYSAPFTPTATVKVRAYSVLTSDNTIVSTEATPAVVRVGTWTGEKNVFDFASAAANYVDITFGDTAVEGIRYYGKSSSQDNAGNFYPITNKDWMTASEGNTAVVSWREGTGNAAFENGGLVWKNQRYFAVSGLTEGQRIKILFDGQLRYRTNVADGAPVVQKDGSVVAAETTYGSSDATNTEITLTIKSGSYLVFYCNTSNDVIKKITVLPAAQNYTLTVTQPANGSIQIGDVAAAAEASYVEDTEVTLTAVANDGYEFDYWTVDGIQDTEHTTPTLTVTMNQAHSVTAAFKVFVEKSVSTTKNWTFEGLTTSTVYDAITAIGNEYYLRGSTNPNRTFTVTECESQELTFSDGTVVTAGKYLASNGSVQGASHLTGASTAASTATNGNNNALSGAGFFAVNTTVPGTLYAMVSSGTAEKKLRVYFADGTTIKYNEFIPTTTDITEIKYTSTAENGGTFFVGGVEASFNIYAVRFVPTSEAVKYTLTITQPANGGSIYAKVNNETVTSPAELIPGSDITLVATPDAGYQLEGWKDGGNAAVGAIPQSLVTTVTMPSHNFTVTATMTAQPEEAPAITTEKVWTFDSFTADTKLSGAGVYEYEGLYIGGHSATNYATVTAESSAVSTGISGNVTNYLALAGGYDKDIASTITANTYKTDAISFKAGVPGVVSVYMSGSYAEKRNFNIWTNGTMHPTEITDNNPVAISQGVSQAGSVFIATSAGAAKIYAVRFLPETITAPTITATDAGVVTITSGASSLSTNYSDLVALKTYYTTDGSEPSATNGTEYTEPFEPGSCTVKAVTVNTKTGNGSESASQVVVIHIAPSTGVPVIIVAGQSNTDGRIAISETAFPYTLNHTLMSYCNGADYTTEGAFEAYGATPKSDSGERWGYDAVVYDKIQTQLGGETDFYVIKQSKGNTAVNLLCAGNGQHWWSANPVWLDRNTSANAGGKSLLLALKSHIDKSLKALEDANKEYDIKFLMWHQGEGDRGKQNEYETQMKAVINEIRNYLVTRTGNNKYSNLPIILGGVASVSKEYSAGVETGKQNLAAADANVYYASTGEMTLADDFRSDEVHFNATGAGKLATSVWDIITTNNLMTGITIAGTNTPAANPLAEDVVSETKTFTFSAVEAINDSKSFDGLYLHGVKVLNKGYDNVTFADNTTAPATYAAQSNGADRSASITERLTGGNGTYNRTFGMNVAGEGTFMAVVRGSSTTDRIRLKFNGEEQHAVWVDSANENILLVGKATGSGTFFITNSEGNPFDLLAARFIAGQTDIEIPATPTYTITTVVTDNGTGTLTANATESPQRETITLTIEPAAGYYLSLLYANQGVVVGENNTFSMPKANVTITATFKPQTTAENDVTTNVSIVDESNATVNSIEIGEGTTTVAVSGTVGGAPVTAIADNTFTKENTASLTSVDLSETAVTMSGERSDIDALKNINASTLIYLPSTANVNGTNVVTKSGDNFTCEDYQIVDGKACAAPHTFTAASATLARTFTADKKCTICLPYAISASGGKYYKFTGISNGKVQMTQQTGTLEANTPYIFVPESDSESISATNVEVSVSNAPQTENTDAGFTFVGTFERLTWEAPIGIYGFAAQERDGAVVGQFVRVGSGASINGCRAYLQYTGDETLSDVSNPSNAPRRAAADMPETMDVEWIAAPADNSSITGVDEVRNKSKEGEEEYFNLNGQRVSTSYKGLIIRNGRKEFRK